MTLMILYNGSSLIKFTSEVESMDSASKKDVDYSKAVSDKTHPLPDPDSKFYRKLKNLTSLKNSKITYNKHRKKLSGC